MKDVRFEWNRKKDLANFRNHGVEFEEAKTVVYDERAIEFYDEAFIRIISSRKATKSEQQVYFERSI